MAKLKTGPSDPAEKEKRRKAAEEKKQLEREQLATRQQRLLINAEAEVVALQQAQTNARARALALTALASHTDGFYDEIDKLAKGKALFAATDLAVQQVNDIIKDAKGIIAGDPHLDRVKEFVPAGDNPVYPDILLVTRAIQQCLSRCAKDIENAEKESAKALRAGRTVAAGLKCWIEKGQQPTKDDVETQMGSKPLESWFYEADDGESYMDVSRLVKDGVKTSAAFE
jgi:hypothetical protein